jgi:hypothetical protein
MLVRFSSSDPAATYLIFTNISRSDSLGGFFGSLKRGVVSKESEDRVRDMLLRAKLRIEADAKGASKAATQTDEVGISATLWKYGQNPLVVVLLVVSTGLIVIFFYRRWKH